MLCKACLNLTLIFNHGLIYKTSLKETQPVDKPIIKNVLSHLMFFFFHPTSPVFTSIFTNIITSIKNRKFQAECESFGPCENPRFGGILFCGFWGSWEVGFLFLDWVVLQWIWLLYGLRLVSSNPCLDWAGSKRQNTAAKQPRLSWKWGIKWREIWGSFCLQPKDKT